MKNLFKTLALLACLAAPIYVQATVSSTTTKTVTANGDSATFNYTIGFPFQHNTDIAVYTEDTSTSPHTLTAITQGAGAGKFTISGGNPGTTVVMGTAPTSSQRLVIQRVTPKTQAVAYSESEAFPASDHEAAMDKFMYIEQELGRSVDAKVGLQSGSTYTTPVMPDPVLDKILAYNHAGTDLALIPSTAPVTNDILRFDGSAWTATQATPTNTVSSVVARDGGGSFSAGTVTASFVGNITGNITGNGTGTWTGNASSATVLAADPTDCSANQFATAIASSGNLTCAQPSFSNLTGIAGVGQGGTNFSTYTIGDMLYASGAGTLSKLGIGANGRYLSVSSGVPAWTAAPATPDTFLTVDVPSGTDPVATIPTDTLTFTTSDSTAVIAGAGSNTIDVKVGSNLTNANIGAAAGIVDTKLATIATAGKVSNSATTATSANTNSAIVARDGSGNFTAGTITANLTGNVTGNTTGTASGNTTYTPSNHGVVVSGSANTMTVIAPDSSTTKVLTSGGASADPVWADAAGGGSGVNYLTNSDTNFETNVGSWAAYADAAGTSPVDGTAGSPTITCTRTTSSPLRGTGSLLVTKDAANRQGNGCSDTFTIDAADVAKPLTVSFDYTVASGTYDAGSDTTDPDITAWVYGPTDGTPVVTQLAGYKVLGGAVGTTMRFQGRFQTASSGVAYRLILHEAKTGTSAYTLKVDNVVVGPDSKSYGAPITDYASVSCSGTWVSNSTYTCYQRRVGDELEVDGQITLSGAPTSTQLYLTLPGGLSIDSNKIAATADQLGVLGDAKFELGNFYQAGVISYGTAATNVGVWSTNTSIIEANVNATVPATWANGHKLHFHYKVPILGWSSTVQMSNDTETRVVAAHFNASSTTINGTPAKVVWTTTDKDSHSAMSSGTYTVPIPGWYEIGADVYITVTPVVDDTSVVSIYRNGASIKDTVWRYKVASATTLSVPVADKFYFNAGDTIEIYASSSGSSPSIAASTTRNTLSISRVSGPSQIAASEKVEFKYTSTSTSTMTGSGTISTVPFATKVHDTHGAFATPTFTVPSAGFYTFYCHLGIDAPGASAVVKAYIYVNGVEKARDQYSAQSTGEAAYVKVEDTESLIAGDTVDCRYSNSLAGAVGLSGVAAANFFVGFRH